MSLVIFDMDGVIIDVSGSYREAIRRTVTVFCGFLKNAAELPRPLFSLADLAYIKQSGGLNNDWDATYKLLDLLANRLTPNSALTDLAALNQIDASPLALFLTTQAAPLKRLFNDYPQNNGMFAHFYQGDIGHGNIIKQIFQEIYLGEKLFKATYGFDPEYVFAPGLIESEPLFLGPPLFKRLAQQYTLAIATGRPLNEALYPLEKHGMRGYFKMLLSHDDCELAAQAHLSATGVKCALGKPHPYMLNTISAAIGQNGAKRYFVGDMPDDMRAAKAAQDNFRALGVAYAGGNTVEITKLLLDNGADVVLESPHALEEFLREQAE